MAKGKEISEGQELRVLIKKDRRTLNEIAEQMGFTPAYIIRCYKMDDLPPNVKNMAFRVFGLNQDFFDIAPGQAQRSPLEKELEGLKNDIDQIKAEIEDTREKGRSDATEAIFQTVLEALKNAASESELTEEQKYDKYIQPMLDLAMKIKDKKQPFGGEDIYKLLISQKPKT